MSWARRDFLLGSASAAVVASTAWVPQIWARTGRQAAQSLGEKTLVVLQLSGGNDGLNTVVPYGDDAYHRNRFATRIESNAVLKIDNYLGWHPAMSGLADLQQQSRLAIVQGVGYPQPNRSHFESMDIWHSAQMETPHHSGWLGRWLDSTSARAGANAASQNGAEGQTVRSIRALHLGDEPLPLALTGLNVMVPSLQSIESLRVTSDRSVREALRQLGTDEVVSESNESRPHELLEFLEAARSTALEASQRLEAIDLQPGKAYGGSDLGRKLASVAQLIAADFGPRVYYVEIAGFDTHSQQAGAHAALLTEVSRSLAGFYDDLKAQGRADQVLTVCFSEFGRRVRENGSGGTDHGTAAPLLIVGPEGLPPLLGRYPSLVELDQGDLVHSVDFRSVYATLLEKWLGVPSEPILGGRFELLPLWS